MKEYIEMIDIFFMTVIELTLSFVLTLFLDKYIFQENHEKDNEKSTIRLMAEFCFYSGILGIILFIIGKGIRRIPFPMDGWYGYKHLQIDEVRYLPLFSIFSFIFCDTIEYKIRELRHRIV